MQIYSGLHMIDAPFENERHINLWLFRGARHILVDSGVAGVPPETILPYLKSVGLEATDLDLLINLHAHADHIGGDAELLTASGGELRIGAHCLDAPAIADHRLLAKVYGLRDEQDIRTLMGRCGNSTPVSEIYNGGEIIDIGGISLEVIHAPGHTAGNISIYDRASRALIHGESVMGPGETDDQSLRSTPFGPDPSAYRRTLEQLGSLDLAWFLSSHRPPTDGRAGRAMINVSMATLDEYEDTCRAVLAQGIGSAKEMAEAVAQEGRYRRGPGLIDQVTHTLNAWLAKGIATSAPESGYKRKRL